jgi:hypothetical protein
VFKKELLEKLEVIFGIKKTTYEAPSEQFEQDTLFIGIGNCSGRVSGKFATFKIAGNLTMYSQNEKLPYGFFQRMIEKAPYEATKDFYFMNFDNDIDSSPARMVNIHERRCDFIYLFKAQVDPNKGLLTSLNISESF